MKTKAEKPMRGRSAEEIMTEIHRQNVLEKIMEELSKLIEKKEYEQEFGRN